MALSDIVNVNITANTKTVSRAGFGTLGILAFHQQWVGTEVRTYTSQAAVEADFPAGSLPRLMAQKAFSQNPSPTRVKIGRRSTGYRQLLRITPTVGGTGTIHSYVLTDISGNTDTVSYTEQAADTVELICDGLHAAAAALTVGLTSSDDTTHQTLTADNLGEIFSCTALTGGLLLEDVTLDAGIAADLSAMLLADPDFYGIVIDSQDHNHVVAAAAWAEAQDVIFAFNNSDGDILTSATDDVFSTLQDSAYARTVGIYSGDQLSFAGAAWMGRMLPTTPGSDTWAFKTLAGVPVDTLSATAETNIQAKDGNQYTETAGINITFEGQSFAGTFVDITRYSDWCKARIQESVFGVLASGGPKIPFTDVGGALLGAAVEQPLIQGERNGGGVPGSTQVFVPKVADIAAADRAARRFRGITFSQGLAGAVHGVPNITGTLTV